MKPFRQLIIVGGGIAGLHTAYRIKSQLKEQCNVFVFEIRPRLGGRIYSIYKKDSKEKSSEENEYKHDAGAWRISSQHQHMINLAKELGIQLNETFAQPARHDPIDVKPGFSMKQSLMFNNSLNDVDLKERMTGYIGSLDGGRRSYSIDSTKESKYLVPQNGMSAYITKLKEKCQAHGVIITTNCRVSSIMQRNSSDYKIKVVHRLQGLQNGQQHSSNEFVEKEIIATDVVFACPVQEIEKIDVNFKLELMPLLKSIKSFPLLRVYMKPNEGHTFKPLHLVTGDALGHIVTTADDRIMMVYCGGYPCNFHQKMYYKDKPMYLRNLKKMYVNNLKKHRHLYDMPEVQAINFEKPICLCHWQSACHFWTPDALFSGFQTAVNNAVFPHETHLPNVYVCGEAVSPEQGWSEGALITSKMVVEKVINKIKGKYSIPYQIKTNHHIVFNDRLLNISKWIHEHPGSQKAIENHMNDKDSTQLMLSIHNHSMQVFSMIHALTEGYLKKV